MSNARNIIINQSKAKYLTFVDADDEINIEGFFIINFLRSQQKEHYELIFGNYTNIKETTKNFEKIINFTNNSSLEKII